MKCHKCGATVPNKQIIRAAAVINAKKRTPITSEQARAMKKKSDIAKRRKRKAKEKART